MTLKQFISENKIRVTSCKLVNSNSNMVDQDWNANHYRVTLTCSRKRMIVFYSMGMAHTSEPTVADVLDCLASDSSNIDQDFESWANDLGYDVDSRRAEKTFKTCQRQNERLYKLLGEENYETLLYKIERL